MDLFLHKQEYQDSDGTIFGFEYLVFDSILDDDSNPVPGDLLCIIPSHSFSLASEWFEDAGVSFVHIGDTVLKPE